MTDAPSTATRETVSVALGDRAYDILIGPGLLAEAGRLPDIVESFYAVTVARRFPNPLVRAMIGDEPRAYGPE
jgi:hypothetical protein